MRKSDVLINASFEIVRFTDLPIPHKKALIWYLAVNGSRWEDLLPPKVVADWQAEAISHPVLRKYEREYGDEVFGFGMIKTDDLIASVATDTHGEFPSREVIEAKRIKQHPRQPARSRFPVVLGASPAGDAEATLADGWTRFATYVTYKYPEIPAVFFVEPYHHELLAKLSGKRSRQ